MRFLLPDKGSNPDLQSQNLLYYHYTIRQHNDEEELQKCGSKNIV